MGNLLVLKPLILGIPVASMEFIWSPFWVQVHGLPLEKLTKNNGEIIGKKIRCLIKVEAHYNVLLLYKNFLRIRVELDITKPIPRGFNLHQSETYLEGRREETKMGGGLVGLTHELVEEVMNQPEVVASSNSQLESTLEVFPSTFLFVEYYSQVLSSYLEEASQEDTKRALVAGPK
ncbi:hypothetical protein ACSBR2_033289 [Camellia fascicularis]